MDDCSVCSGDLKHIGNLGGICWFRCRDCGMEFHSAIQHNKMDDWWQDLFTDYDNDDIYYDEDYQCPRRPTDRAPGF